MKREPSSILEMLAPWESDKVPMKPWGLSGPDWIFYTGGSGGELICSPGFLGGKMFGQAELAPFLVQCVVLQRGKHRYLLAPFGRN